MQKFHEALDWAQPAASGTPQPAHASICSQPQARALWGAWHRTLRGGLICAVASVGLLACGGGGGSNPSGGSAGAPVILPSPASSALQKALLSGDSSELRDTASIAVEARRVAQLLENEQSARVASIFQGVSSAYAPGNQSHFVLPTRAHLSHAYIVGDKGGVLASMSVAQGGRATGYGVNVLEQFDSGELVHAAAFKRLVGWLVRGNTEQPLPAELPVAWLGIDTDTALSGMAWAGISAQTVACDLSAPVACAAKAKLVVIGSGLTPSSRLQSDVRALMQLGVPVLYLHTAMSSFSEAGTQVLGAMELSLGSYGGNYWDDDKVAAGQPLAVLQARVQRFGPLMQTLANETFGMPYDWSACDEDDCSNVVGLARGLAEMDALRGFIDAFNRSGTNIFSTPDTTLERLMVLWADVARRTIRYPMDKLAKPAALQKAAIADSIVSYVRDVAPAQPDLGSYASPQASTAAVTSSDETVDIRIPAKGGFTAIGRFAVAGKPLQVELLSGGSATLGLRINTLREGTTKLWRPGSYDRPRFPSSPTIALSAGRALTLTTPYGGTLQLQFDKATAGQTVRLRLRGVAKHPYLDLSSGTGDRASFLAALNNRSFDWAEFKLPGVEAHTRTDMLREVVANPYRNDLDRYLDELKSLFFEDLYQLAGFAVSGKSLTTHVQSMCTSLNWDCTSSKLHQVPSTQHINVDTYALCGSGCSGNPYDQTWPLSPRGWGESHEVGHNNQPDRLRIYDDRSGEVSNNIFPLHKYWRMARELGDNQNDDAVGYQSAFNMIKASKQESDPVQGAYQRIWGSADYAVQNAERMAFYMQWVHYWAQRQGAEATGWDIVTLLYLHDRLFAATDWASSKAKLGYSQYSARPDVSGNDNLLIALSWITQRDQRATFDLWGVRYSSAAASQVAAYGYRPEPAFFYANTRTNSHAGVRRVEMTGNAPVWPF